VRVEERQFRKENRDCRIPKYWYEVLGAYAGLPEYLRRYCCFKERQMVCRNDDCRWWRNNTCSNQEELIIAKFRKCITYQPKKKEEMRILPNAHPIKWWGV
jgi:hypothetical protein